MEYSMKRAQIPGTPVSGIDVWVQRHWQSERPCSLTVDAFPTVDGTGVSAGGCRT
jgi:hypothetical protein